MTITAWTGVVDYSFEAQWNDVGSGSVTFVPEDAALASITYGSVIQCQYLGAVVFAFIATKRESDTIPDGGDIGTVTWSGPGRASGLSGSRVRPSRGFGVEPVEQTRTFGWASVGYDDSTWGELTISLGTGPTDYWYGLANWADPAVEWMWTNNYSATTSWAPTGDIYVRNSFTVTGGLYKIECAIDDRGTVFIDGQRMIETGSWDNTTSSIHSVDVALSAGTHTVAIFAQNNTGVYGNNPAGIRFRVADSLGATVFSSGAGWTCLAYPWFPPGVTIGTALLGMISEAQTAGCLTDLTVGFNAVTDSNGTPWPFLADVTADVGSDILSFLRSHAGVDVDFFVAGGSFHLDCWVPGSSGTTRSITLAPPTSSTDPTSGNLRSLDHQSEHVVANAAVIRYAKGWTYIATGATPIEEIMLELSHIVDEDEATRVALDELTRLGNTREQVTATIQVRTGETPWWNYQVGDFIVVPDSTGTPTSQRVISLALVNDGDEYRITPTFKDRILEDFERHENWLKQMSDGAARGQTSAATPPKLPPPSYAPSPIAEKTWSLPTWAAKTNGGVYPAATTFLTRDLTLSLDSAATGTRTASLIVDGTSVGTVTVAAGATSATVVLSTTIAYGSRIGITTTGTESFGGNINLTRLPG